MKTEAQKQFFLLTGAMYREKNSETLKLQLDKETEEEVYNNLFSKLMLLFLVIGKYYIFLGEIFVLSKKSHNTFQPLTCSIQSA